MEFGLVHVTNVTKDSLLDDLATHLKAKRGFAVATVNLDHLVKLRRDAAFRNAYGRQTHIVADGNPVVWLQRLAGRRAALITGSDLVDPLMSLATRQQVRVAFLGSTQEALDLAAERLEQLHPGLEVVARIAPGFGFDPMSSEADASIARIEASGAQLCLVALGAPKQEMFAARAMGILPDRGFVSIGAGLDFVAGTQRRAPLWYRRMALEWLWRLAGDRRRLARRYWDCALIFPTLVKLAMQERLRGSAPTLPPPHPRPKRQTSR